MDSSSAERAIAIQLCPRCLILFLAPKNEEILKLPEEEIRIQAEKMIKLLSSETEINKRIDDQICPCCFNAFVGDTLHDVCASLELVLSNSGLHDRPIFLRVLIPPMLDTARITVRTIVTVTNEKVIPFPTMAELTYRLIVDELVKISGLNIVCDVTLAEVQVNITGAIPNQTEYCQSLYPGYHHKKKKAKFGMSASVEPFEVTRADADSVLISYKTFKLKDFEQLQSTLQAYMKPGVSPLTWQSEIQSCPIYLLGRYRKYARDVPQAPWTLDDERKGRNSVEEIISEAVKKTFKGASCKLHPCGREDIDVRCLGNGRPFILEVSGSYVDATEECMQDIIRSVSAQSPDSFNSEGDVELLMLKKSHRSVWENMQTVAEEKRKAYRCVCWSAEPINAEVLKMLESYSSCTGNVDEEGRPCLKLIQKTPLRVLHRRSLLDRVRFVYDIKTARLNEHFFLMDITTSAGTYVKEFVHGDLGRTVPSVCSLLKCQADILQLDVVWLFDDFEGGGEPPDMKPSFSDIRFASKMPMYAEVSDVQPTSVTNEALCENKSLLQSCSWDDLKKLRIIPQKC